MVLEIETSLRGSEQMRWEDGGINFAKMKNDDRGKMKEKSKEF